MVSEGRSEKDLVRTSILVSAGRFEELRDYGPRDANSSFAGSAGWPGLAKSGVQVARERTYVTRYSGIQAWKFDLKHALTA